MPDANDLIGPEPKLSLLARHITEQNHGDMLALAETHTAKELDAILRGEDPARKTRAMVLYFSQEEVEVLEVILLNFGAERARRGLVNREAAIMDMAWWAQEQLDRFFDIEAQDGQDDAGGDVEGGDLDCDGDDGGPISVLGTTSTNPRLLLRLLERAHAERDQLQADVDWLKWLVSRIIAHHQARLKKLGFKEFSLLDTIARNENDAGEPSQ